MWFWNTSKKPTQNVRLESISLPEDLWTLRIEKPGQKVWSNAQGDARSLNFFNVVPDLAANLIPENLHILRNDFRSKIPAGEGGLVSLDLVNIQNIPALQIIIKVRIEQIRGFMYAGSCLIPRADFSHVIRFECIERSPTGLREAMVMMVNKQFTGNLETGKIIGWNRDPYDPAFDETAMYNFADEEIHDAQFPDHPLTRVRQHLRTLSQSIVFDPLVLKSKPFQKK